MVEASSASVLDRTPHQTTSKELERDLPRGRPEGLGPFPASSLLGLLTAEGLSGSEGLWPCAEGQGQDGREATGLCSAGRLGLSPGPLGRLCPHASLGSHPGLPLVVIVVLTVWSVRTLGCWVLVGVGGSVGRPWESLGGRSSLPHRCCSAKTGLASWQVSAALGQASFCVPAPLASAGSATLSSSPQPTWGGGRALGSLRPEPQ